MFFVITVMLVYLNQILNKYFLINQKHAYYKTKVNSHYKWVRWQTYKISLIYLNIVNNLLIDDFYWVPDCYQISKFSYSP